MSMREYGVQDYGMVLDDAALRELARSFCADFSDSAWDAEKYDFIEDMTYNLDGFEVIYSFTGEAWPFDDYGVSYDDPDGDTYNDDECYYIGFEKTPSLFSKAYDNVEDIVREMRRKVGLYLPIDFNYRDHLRHIVGSYYA